MGRILACVLLVGLSCAWFVPAESQVFRGPDSAKKAAKAARKEQKAAGKAARKQQKAARKYQKAQRKAAKRANRHA